MNTPRTPDDPRENIVRIAPVVCLCFLNSLMARAQDLSPLRDCHVWLPMTGVTREQIDDAVAAGYDTMMLKVHPPVTPGATGIHPALHEDTISYAAARGLKLVLAVLGWVGLGDGEFWDTDRSGAKIMNRLDPFWPEAMRRVEWYYGRVIDCYARRPNVVAFAPTWGIYGEAGFTSFAAGCSQHALARFNEWRRDQYLPPLDRLPARTEGPNTEYNRFIRFRYLYIEERFDEMVTRLKERAGGIPVGMWQELYPVVGYLWTMVEVPSADFALYEACFPFQTLHHPEKSLAEIMGFRYRCASPEDYRDYVLPLLARKRGEGQRFMGCQLSNSYAKNYGWSEEKAKQVHFDRWEDEFGPYLKKLLDEPLESPKRDVLLVFPTYEAAALSDHMAHGVDTRILDTLLRMYGCQLARCGSPRLDKMSVRDLDRFRLIVVPNAAYLIPQTWEKLRRTRATVLFTGCFGQAFDAVQTPFGGERSLDGVQLRYLLRKPGEVTVDEQHPLTGGMGEYLQGRPVRLPEDEVFDYAGAGKGIRVLVRCAEVPLISIGSKGRMIFLHGQLLAGLCHDPDRVPPDLGFSADPSAREMDMWGPYSSTSPRNAFGRLLVRNILDFARVDYRVPDPKPRALVPYLGDHMEPVSISANFVYNNTAEPQTLTLRLPYRPRDWKSKRVGKRYEAEVTVPRFSYVPLRRAR